MPQVCGSEHAYSLYTDGPSSPSSPSETSSETVGSWLAETALSLRLGLDGPSAAVGSPGRKLEGGAAANPFAMFGRLMQQQQQQQQGRWLAGTEEDGGRGSFADAAAAKMATLAAAVGRTGAERGERLAPHQQAHEELDAEEEM